MAIWCNLLDTPSGFLGSRQIGMIIGFEYLLNNNRVFFAKQVTRGLPGWILLATREIETCSLLASISLDCLARD